MLVDLRCISGTMDVQYSHHNVYEFYICERQWISGLHDFITTKLMKNA
jgi:hypothetical protein